MTRKLTSLHFHPWTELPLKTDPRKIWQIQPCVTVVQHKVDDREQQEQLLSVTTQSLKCNVQHFKNDRYSDYVDDTTVLSVSKKMLMTTHFKLVQSI